MINSESVLILIWYNNKKQRNTVLSPLEQILSIMTSLQIIKNSVLAHLKGKQITKKTVSRCINYNKLMSVPTEHISQCQSSVNTNLRASRNNRWSMATGTCRRSNTFNNSLTFHARELSYHEAYRLASKVINRQNVRETNESTHTLARSCKPLSQKKCNQNLCHFQASVGSKYPKEAVRETAMMGGRELQRRQAGMPRALRRKVASMPKLATLMCMVWKVPVTWDVMWCRIDIDWWGGRFSVFPRFWSVSSHVPVCMPLYSQIWK